MKLRDNKSDIKGTHFSEEKKPQTNPAFVIWNIGLQDRMKPSKLFQTTVKNNI